MPRLSLACVVLMLLAITTQASEFATKVHFSFYGELTDDNFVAVAPWVDKTLEPLDSDQYKTTHSRIYLDNLNSRINTFTQQAKRSGEPRWWLNVAHLLFYRLQLLGRIADIESIQQILQQRLNTLTDVAAVWLLHVKLDLHLHEFESAQAALSQAEHYGADTDTVSGLRLQIHIALGHDVLTRLQQRASAKPSFYSYADLANAYLDQGDLSMAAQLFNKAQSFYRDTSPTPLAWLYVQQGVGYLRYGAIAQADKFFAAAYQRFPQYYLAVEYLAYTKTILKQPLDALLVFLYQDQEPDNPNYFSALAFIEERLGNRTDAQHNHAQASALYETFLSQYPAAWWQHAAEYFFSQNDNRRALQLARKNTELRQTVSSLLLQARIEDALQQRDAACTTWLRLIQYADKAPETVKWQRYFNYCRLDNTV